MVSWKTPCPRESEGKPLNPEVALESSQGKMSPPRGSGSTVRRGGVLRMPRENYLELFTQ